MSIPSKVDFIRDYWDYYLYLEKKVLQTEQYVDFNKDNYKVYSKEYVSLLLLLLAESDKLFKVICECYGEDKDKMHQYRDVLNKHYTKSSIKEKVETLYDLKSFYPLSGFDKSRSPQWWYEANKVKHNRVDYYKYANLRNVLTALACVYKLNIFLLELVNGKKHFDVPNSMMFMVPKGYTQNMNLVLSQKRE